MQDMKNLIREYHDGLLMIEMSNREVGIRLLRMKRHLKLISVSIKNNISGLNHVLRVLPIT